MSSESPSASMTTTTPGHGPEPRLATKEAHAGRRTPVRPPPQGGRTRPRGRPGGGGGGGGGATGPGAGSVPSSDPSSPITHNRISRGVSSSGETLKATIGTG